jgi:AmmeMemoRadiSam system protein A
MHTEIGSVIVPIARAAIGEALGVPAESDESAPWLREPGASFVTLRCEGELRGCIGTLEAHRILLEDVKINAVAAALRDTRFPPLQRKEWLATRVEVSILSPLDPIEFDDETDALAQLRPGVDGVVFVSGVYRSTFLPQVWEGLPEPREFMAHLKRKAGLPAHFWSDEVELLRYTVQKFMEH